MKLEPKRRRDLAQALIKEINLYTQARMEGDHQRSYHHLGRAHMISQYKWFNHFYIHFLMFEYSWKKKDWNEVLGQVIRMVATIPGHLFNRLPIGNNGWSSVPLMAKQPLPADLEKLLNPEPNIRI